MCFLVLSILQKNKDYSFDFFQKNKNNAHEAYKTLFQKMREISSITMKELLSWGKQTGLETLFYNAFNPPMQGVLKNTRIVSGDSKLVFFRFCNGKYRMICKSDREHQNILHIIGFDFNYTAYHH